MQNNFPKKLINRLMSRIGLSLVNTSRHELAITKSESFEKLIKTTWFTDWTFIPLLNKLSDNEKQAIYPYILLSKSQIAQDLFVVSQSSSPEFPRFFVEFGATDGIKLSNTYILEKYLGWQGIVAEPAKIWHNQLIKNRSCAIDFNCVTNSSGKLVEFLEASTDPNDEMASAELSSISSFAESVDNQDEHTERRLRNSKKYMVPTISLNDLLLKHSAPRDMGYLSIDTEGSELSILKTLDFDQYSFRVITVEHNYINKNRESIHSLLSSHQYRRVFEDISLWDDWYVLS